jgi:2-dehydro-3-deoxy-D-arabinonate dehydratase
MGSIRFARCTEGLALEKSGVIKIDRSTQSLESLLHLSNSVLYSKLNEHFQLAEESSVSLLNPFDPCVTPVFGAGVTFANSLRERRLEALRGGSMEETTDDGRPTAYDVVYDPTNPPEVFFKASHAGHLAKPDELCIRPDGGENDNPGSSVPEPERVLIVNSRGEIIAETIGSDTTARQLESLSPLYLPAAKTYFGSTTLCPWLTVFEPGKEREPVTIKMEIFRNGETMYSDSYSSDQMKRTPESLVRHMRTLAPNQEGTFENGFALFTGTGIIPPIQFSLAKGDIVEITSPQLGAIRAVTKITQFNF